VPGIDGFLAAEQHRPDIPARMAHAVRVPRPDPIDVDAFLEACRGQGIPAWRRTGAHAQGRAADHVLVRDACGDRRALLGADRVRAGGWRLSAEQRALPQRGSPEIAKPEDFNHIERQFVVPQVTGVHGSVSALPPPEIDDAAVAEALSCSITASAL
jgi:hypothetical protein